MLISTDTLKPPLCLYLFWGSVVAGLILRILPGDVSDMFGHPGVKGLEDKDTISSVELLTYSIVNK